ncbi:DNA cytosine methyltransferase [Xanthomonas graminis]|uniref:DNA cytosine methyltransferase n=1 Tax=Xanthomonas graminis TaxID=3390026 RepID=UPI001F37E7FE|nr:DNA (cytosine-5-)-methyltransferase [Xanthomonas translucens]UKE73246.1 DNA cytosine methyltransferase [Xanthomonas translucens pv. phleipratensis]
MPTVVSLFSGCGGSDQGVIDAGFDVMMANDILQYARDVYVANHPDTDFKLCSVAEISSFPKADLLVGCYPCQGFSQAGVRDPGRSINYLYREFDRALRQIKPKAFIVENVAGMRRSDSLHLFNNQLKRFRLAGYRVNAKVLNATDYGVSQERARLFFVGIRSDLGMTYTFPEPSHDPTGNSQTLPATPVLKDVIGHLPDWPEGEFDPQPFHWYYLSRNRRRGWHELSKTIVANSRHVPLHPSSPELIRLGPDEWTFSSDKPARRLSYREGACIQGFQSDMKFPDTFGLQLKYRVVGNAVPPPLFRAVAEALPDIW